MIINFSAIKPIESSKYLKANAIHDVIFKGASVVTGTKGDGTPWTAIDLLFENEEGLSYRERVFEPTEEQCKRTTSTFGDRTIENPSRAETIAGILAQVGIVLEPVNYEKFANLNWTLPKDFKKMAELYCKAMSKAVGKKTKLKLVANKDGYASIPSFFVTLDSDGNPRIKNSWLGDNVAFTEREKKKMVEETSKPEPTKAEEFSPNIQDEDAGEFDIAKFDLD